MKKMRRARLITTYCFALTAAFLGCGGIRQPEAPKPEPIYFSPAEVCGYPATSPAKTFTRLGGGKWGSSDAAIAGAAYECVGANNKVQLFKDGGSIEVDYFVTGVETGASMITLNYAATSSQPIPNESTYRNVFANLTELISRQGLKAIPSDLFRKKLSNLNSYDKPGEGSDEIFDVGAGFVALSREASPDKLNINVAVKFYPDVNLKLAK